MKTRWPSNACVLLILMLVPSRTAFAQGDGPRTHWKELLTNTSIFSLTHLQASGNSNPFDPAHLVIPGASFDANLTVVGYTRSFSLFDRTALWSAMLPVGDLSGETTGPVPAQDFARGFGDPLLQLDVNLIGAPAMVNIPALMAYEPDVTVDLVLTLGIPIGEYDDDSVANIGLNRWFGRIGVPIMVSLGDWVPGSRTTLEFLPAVWVFEDNDDFLGQSLENDPLIQLESHLTRDFTETFWGSLDAVWYGGADATIASMSAGGLGDLSAGFTLAYQINDNLSLSVGYAATVGNDSDDLDMGTFHITLAYGWHQLMQGIGRLGGG